MVESIDIDLVTPFESLPALYPDAHRSDRARDLRRTVKGGLEALFKDDPNVFVAGDLLWYPVEGNDKIRVAPDTMVAFGRPKGYRGSYKQWQEDNIAPQVVFEILSPGNTLSEMAKKLELYDRYGAEEYYLYDPDKNDLSIWLRLEERLTVVEQTSSWVSPRLGVRFELTPDTMQIYRPDGRPFATYVELDRQRETAEQRVNELEAKLRALGIDPDA